jgi:hypothetical protein
VLTDRFKVAMTASLAEYAPRPKDPGPADEAALNRDGNTSIQPPCITHGREASTQHSFKDELGLDCDPRRLSADHRSEVKRCNCGMNVCIDQARHEGSALGIENHNIGVCTEFTAVLRDFNDLVLFDAKRRSRSQFSSTGIQKLCVFDDQVRHGDPLDVAKRDCLRREGHDFVPNWCVLSEKVFLNCLQVVYLQKFLADHE